MNLCTTRLSRLACARRAASVAAALAVTMTLAAPDAFAQKAKRPEPVLNVLPMSITSVTVVNGALVATGAVGSNVFTAPVTLTPLTQPTDGSCPILDLSLGPIHLTLLGLNVDTSAICLKITAHQGGGLLGDLLCAIGGQLNLGTPLGTILGGLSTQQLDTLNTGLTSLLNQAVFTPLTSSRALDAATCSVLDLSLGPIDLTLLGLQVQLDDCDGGPVTLAITATQGGGLLGDLLCGLSTLLQNPRAPLTAVLGVLSDIAAAIGQLVG